MSRCNWETTLRKSCIMEAIKIVMKFSLWFDERQEMYLWSHKISDDLFLDIILILSPLTLSYIIDLILFTVELLVRVISFLFFFSCWNCVRCSAKKYRTNICIIHLYQNLTKNSLIIILLILKTSYAIWKMRILRQCTQNLP